MFFSFSLFVPSVIIMYVQRQTHFKAVALIPYLSEIKWNTMEWNYAISGDIMAGLLTDFVCYSLKLKLAAIG